MGDSYKYKNCQSLFGYAESVHQRSGGICQLCDCGSGQAPDFDLWRQMTVEHLIGESQYGYLKQIRPLVAQRFPGLAESDIDRLARRIDASNTVTACSFCNSTTSRDKHGQTMKDLILKTDGTPNDVAAAIAAELATVLEKKRITVHWKLDSIRKAFQQHVEEGLIKSRSRLYSMHRSG